LSQTEQYPPLRKVLWRFRLHVGGFIFFETFIFSVFGIPRLFIPQDAQTTAEIFFLLPLFNLVLWAIELVFERRRSDLLRSDNLKRETKPMLVRVYFGLTLFIVLYFLLGIPILQKVYGDRLVFNYDDFLWVPFFLFSLFSVVNFRWLILWSGRGIRLTVLCGLVYACFWFALAQISAFTISGLNDSAGFMFLHSLSLLFSLLIICNSYEFLGCAKEVTEI
jgi:hypothetical protein